MIDKLFAPLAPHYCYGCGLVGVVLCESCNYDIITQTTDACLVCTQGFALHDGICQKCRPPYRRIWSVGGHVRPLRPMIDDYKFKSSRSIADDLASLLDEILPILPKTCVVVPVPTIQKHIRSRGFDHTALLAQKFAKLRNLPIETGRLMRQTSTVQHEADAKLRRKQAQVAFAVRDKLLPSSQYLLIDDIMTTGSTLHYAAKALQQAGAKEVWVAILARHDLE